MSRAVKDIPSETSFPVVASGRYVVEDKLGVGGMGVVYRARDTSGDRVVALKRMGKPKESTKSAQLRFRREFHSLASLRHPRIVRAFDYGVDADGPFYTMELLEGRDLRDEKNLSPRDIALVLRDVAAALAYLHARGLVHRDLTPRNVRRDSEGRAKVIDFGVLGTIGLTGDVAGTLSYIAPEAFRGLPIDGRADLYSLGVLGYFLLTEHVPYDVKNKDVEIAFRDPPRPPSAWTGAPIPNGLEPLILALLSADPMARPPSAADVIERLGIAFGLPPLEADEVARGYLASAAMVGRKRELAIARRRIGRAARGRGGGVLFRAESGAGKSRLLREAQLEGKLAGCIVVRTDCEHSARGPYGALAELSQELFAAAPALALRTATPHVDALVAAFPHLEALADLATERGIQLDPGEERMRIQRGLLDWLLAFAEDKPIVLVVDDVQRCDEASCAVLASLLHENKRRKLLVVLAERTGEEIRAKAALDAIRDVLEPVDLVGLGPAEVKELLVALFGEVPNIERLATWMADATGGSPLFATELARHLVDRGVVRWVDGTWVIPGELPEVMALPKGLAAAVDARLERLGERARAIGELLALHGGDLGLDFIVTLGRAAGMKREEEIFEAVDELAREGVLAFDVSTYRFRHDGYREGMGRLITDARRPELHRVIGEALLGSGDVDPSREAKIGWHLLEGGDEQRGAALLRSAGDRLYTAQALADCLAPFEAALAVLDRLPGTEARLARNDIVCKLLAAGWVSDRKVGTRYARRAVVAWREECGFATAQRLAPYVGLTIGLVIGVTYALARWAGRGFRGDGPVRAMTVFATSLAYACGLANAESRVDDLLELLELARPMSVFPIGTPRGIYCFLLAFPDVLLGRIQLGTSRFSEAVDRISRDRYSPVSPQERFFAEVAARGMRLLLDVNQFERRIDEDLAVIDGSPFRYYHLVAAATRIIRHRYRGEEDRAQRLERKMEVASVQLGSWSTDVQILLFAHPAYALCHDALGLRRCIEKLEVLVAQGFRLETRMAITRADYLRERGDVRGAVDLLRPVVANMREDDLLMGQWAGSSLSEAHLAAGEYEECVAAAKRVLSLASTPGANIVLPRLRATSCLAAALSALGRNEEAIGIVEPAIEEASSIDCAPLAGALHTTRARIALAMQDRDAYGEHGAAAIRWLRPTRNPALIALCERLVEAGAEARFADARVDAEWAVTVPAGSSRVDKGSTSDAGPTSASGSGSASAVSTRDAITIMESESSSRDAETAVAAVDTAGATSVDPLRDEPTLEDSRKSRS